DGRAIEDEPPFPDAEELLEGQVENPNERQTGTQHSADQEPQRQIVDALPSDAFTLRTPACQPDAEDKGQRQHDAETIQRKALRGQARDPDGNAKKDLLHRCPGFATSDYIFRVPRTPSASLSR